jgi:hypothetical protein
VTVRIEKDRLSGQASGKGALTLSLGKSWAGRTLQVNGKPGTFDDAGRIEVALPEGGGTLVAESANAERR